MQRQRIVIHTGSLPQPFDVCGTDLLIQIDREALQFPVGTADKKNFANFQCVQQSKRPVPIVNLNI